MNPTISLPVELIEKISREASARGVSIEEFVRLSVEQSLAESISRDPLFADDAVYDGEAPADLSANHDEYLYGENP